jgi:2-methylaconitate cis-trans-isomerase PrpF
MVEAGLGHVLKVALISCSPHPMFDLDYRFVQVVPGPSGDTLDFLGSCGHSIVASVLVANQISWLPRLAPGNRVRVNVLNNNDNVVCEIDEVGRTDSNMTVHFLQEPAVDLSSLLVTGSPLDTLIAPGGSYPVSVVSMGNPYVFVRARDMGVTSLEQLFAPDPDLFDTMAGIRHAAGARWGWPTASAFPKIAAVDTYAPGRIAVRAISVPTWHPTIALTGAICVGTAAAIAGTVVHAVAADAGCRDGNVTIQTPGGTTDAYPVVIGSSSERPRLSWVSVGGKRARYERLMHIDISRDQLTEESAAWMAVSA